MGPEQTRWWETRGAVIAFALLALVPLLWPAIPPLVDLPGHMGRYRVQLDGAGSSLRQFYDFKWALIGNLGVDLLIIPVAKIFGLELGTKLIVMAIPALTVTAFLWIAREVHGRIPPTALFALPLAYGHPFLFGFVNFALAMALALLSFALWLRMARLGAAHLRPYVFFPISILLWVCHTYGWGMLGVLAFSAELIRQHDRDPRWLRATVNAAIHCLPMAFPLALMIAWRSGAVSGQTGDWFNWSAKLTYLNMTLRDQSRLFDALSVSGLLLLIFFAIRDSRLGFSRNLAASALFLLVVYLCLPRIVFGSAYADMRLTPYMIAIAIVAIRLRPQASGRFAGGLAMVALVFVGARTAATTASFATIAGRYDAALGALAHVPEGARLVSFVGFDCEPVWSTSRMEHLPAIAIVRRRAFSNDQWNMAGAQLMRTRNFAQGYFGHDPSQLVTQGFCARDKWRSLDWSLKHLPRGAFDYVWMIAPPRFDPRGLRGMTRIWQNGSDALYRIDDRRMEP